jgi:Ca2+-binding RTX toxin-like protein
LKEKGYTILQSATGTNKFGVETTTSVASGAASTPTIYTAGRKAVDITGNASDDTIIGSSLNDTISGGSGGNDSIDGGAGNDTFTYVNVGDVIDGGDGKDTLKITNIAAGYASTSDSDDNLVNVEYIIVADDNEAAYNFSKQTDGFNITITATGDSTVTGSQGDDSIIGSGDSDVILGDAGNDTITGAGGTDVITGGAGDDVFVIDAGSTVIDEITDFGNGADSFKGVYTGTGNVLKVGIYSTSTTELDLSATMGAGASASVTGGAADDAIIGGKSDDTIIGSAGADNIQGGAGADSIFGNTGKDTIAGGSGADIIKLANGTDSSASAGDITADVVVVSAGDSTATVTAADGTTHLSTFSGNDKISYFELAGVDLLDLDSPSIASNQSSLVNGTDSTAALTSAGTDYIKAHVISSGIITFDDQDASTFGAVTLGDANDVAAAIQYLIANDIGDAGTTVAFVGNSNTYVYQQTGSGTGSHVLVELVGITATSLITAGTTSSGLLIG